MFAKPRPKKDLMVAPSKKRKTTHAVEEVTFDNSARAEYLTGFHKRKVARQKEGRKQAEEQARQERIQARREVRSERKQQIEEHVRSVEAMLRESRVAGLGPDAGSDAEAEDDDKEWDGIEDAPPPALEPVDHEEEYIDEDLYTTVKVEAVSVDRDGLHNKKEVEAADEAEEDKHNIKRTPAAARPVKERNPHWDKKKKKFKYESKMERSLGNRKIKQKNAQRKHDRKGD